MNRHGFLIVEFMLILAAMTAVGFAIHHMVTYDYTSTDNVCVQEGK